MKRCNEVMARYLCHVALRCNPEQRSQRVRRDEVLVPEIERVWQANRKSMVPTRSGGN